jgi:RNA polymerase sigma factor (sigma-70 family)
MADACLYPLLHHVRALAGAPRTQGLSDGELLHAFLSRQDQAAFDALVRRHGPMVLNTCRRLLRHQQDAEDAFQATFLTLARKAASIRANTALAGWLYGTACRMALSIKRAAARRHVHERRAQARSPGNPLTELAWRKVQALLEEEIQRLPGKYRVVFVLCCLESQSRAEVGRRLGLKEGTVSSRLAYARRRLQHRLARRGVTLTSLLAAAALTRPAGGAVPAALLAGTVRAASAVALSTKAATAGVSAQVAALLKEGLPAAWATPLRIMTGLVLTAAVLVGGAGLIARPSPATQPPGGKAALPVQAPDRQAGQSQPAASLPVPADLYRDPLPLGATARLGTLRFRHGSTVTGLAFAPDGKTLVSGSYDKTLRLWDVTTGRELRRLPSLAGSVSDLCASQDGMTLAAVEYVGGCYLGDLRTGRLTQLQLRPGDAHTCVALSPDGKTLAVGCWDLAAGSFTVRLWELASGKELHECPGHKGKVLRVAFAPEGKALATGSADGTTRVWDVATGREVLRLEGKQAVTAVAFSCDGHTLATGCEDGKVRLWQVPSGNRLYESDFQGLGVQVVAFSPDRKRFASGVNGRITVWDLATREPLRQLRASVETIAFSPDGGTLASGSHDCTIRLWDVSTGKERALPAAGHRGSVRGVAVSADGTVATTAGGDRLYLWEVASGKELSRLDVSGTWYAAATTLALSPDGTVVATDSGLWNRATGKALGRLKGLDCGIESIAFSPDGRTLALGTQDIRPGKDRTIRLWDVARVKERTHFGVQPVHALGYSPDGRTLAAGNGDGTISLWDVATGREGRRIKGHQREVNSVAFAPDGQILASSSFDGEVFLWDAATGKQGQALRRARQVNVLAVTFSPNGKMLASAEQPFTSEDRACITLWEVVTGQVRLRLAGHAGDVNCLAFAGDSKTLVSGSTDTTALVWDVTAPVRAALVRSGGLSVTSPEALWAELLAADAARGYRAACVLAASPDGVGLLGQHLLPAPVVDEHRVRKLLTSLDSGLFKERRQASQELERLGEAVEPALLKWLEGQPSLEVRQRLEQLLDKLSSEWLRTLRAVEALELAGTPAAEKVLQALAGGAPEARRTREARAALERFTRRRPARAKLVPSELVPHRQPG